MQCIIGLHRIQMSLSRWVYHQLIDHRGFDAVECGVQMKKLVTSEKKNVNHNTGPFLRAVAIKYHDKDGRYPSVGDSYECIPFLVTVGSVSCIYSIIYTQHGSIRYVGAAPAYESQDGEYRNNFQPIKAFNDVYNTRVETIPEINIMERVISSLVENNIITLNHCDLPGEPRIGIRLLVSSVLRIIPYIITSSVEKHLSSNFISFINDSDIINLAKKIEPSFAGTVMREGPYGAKLVPMFEGELLDPSDFNLPTWREVYINTLVTDLFCDCIAEGFALYGGWALAENSGAFLYDNESMRMRYVRSELAPKLLGDIRSARKHLAEIPPNTATVEIDASLYDDLSRVRKMLTISTTSMIHWFEHVGVTINELWRKTSITTIPYLQGLKCIFNNKNTGAKHIFNVIYSLYCIHNRLGIVHTDLHANNIMVHFYVNNPPYSQDDYVMYVTGPSGEIETYIFQESNHRSFIIDFSRAIVGPEFRKHLIKSHNDAYADMFYHNQINRVLRALHRVAPSIVAGNQDSIRAAIISNYDKIFLALSAADFMTAAASFAVIFKAAPAGAVDPELPLLVSNLEDASREILVANLLAIIGGRHDDVVNPGPKVFDAVFGSWQFTRWAIRNPKAVKDASIVGGCNFNNPLKYSLTTPSAYPPWLNAESVLRHSDADDKITLDKMFLNVSQPKPIHSRIDFLSEKILAEVLRQDGHGADAASSWVE